MSNCSSGTYNSPYGKVHLLFPGPFRDPPYDNVRVYAQTATRHVMLQGPALQAFKDAEDLYWDRLTARQKRKAGSKHILLTGVGYRSFTLQRALYESDPPGSHSRYADPDCSNHVEALAVDLDTGQHDFDKKKAALKAKGFNFTVSGEVWHGAFRVEG
jgi:hypothetical protein